MAIMQNLSNGEKVFLKSHHVFGRSRVKADTILEGKEISHIHASVRWNGRAWMVTDLGRNGTWMNDIRLRPGKSAGLDQGDSVRFGIGKDYAWKLIDQSPPATILVPLQSDGPIVKLGRFHVLPDDRTPDVSIYISPSGKWVREDESGVIPLNNGDIVHHGQKAWQFFCAEPVDATDAGEHAKEAKFFFHVSLDEEHVFLKIRHGENWIDLGERVHHYMLLTLARQRLKDAENGGDRDTHGWIEPGLLSDMLGLDASHLNIQIYRVRKQIDAALPEASNLPLAVERRVGSLRFGYADFQIQRGSSIEGTLCRGNVL